tara:strand:- start:197 stop:529 length:333 start_codon:yes stop_codon:yes gene_type:complete
MRGGYRYRSGQKKSIRMRRSKAASINNSRRVTAGRKMTKRKMTKRNKHKRHRKKSRRHNRKQSGGMAPFNDAISARLAEGPHLNTVQGYSADLNNAPIMGHSTVTQCENA